MRKPPRKKRIHAFTSNFQGGSPQWLHFYDSNEEMRKSFSSFQVTDEWDHSFVYLASNSLAYVRWKNKAGPIQLCGSASYALAYFITSELQGTHAAISSSQFTLHLKFAHGTTHLELPPHEVLPTRLKGMKDLFYHKESEIFFFETCSENDLEKTADLMGRAKEIEYAGVHPIHGFCAFHWNSGQNQGFLRYFTPWHGRDEDYVTGSIHRYLTPLVHDLYGPQTQEWHQLSDRGGQIQSTLTDTGVTLHGNCSLEESIL